jgi:DNA (cytosine-5)-methyltransferase 1
MEYLFVPTMLDLFSGIGGFSLAANWAGFKTIQFVEIDPFCQKVLSKNFPSIPIHGDIKNFNFNTNVNLITGGFPCQPFSTLGNKNEKADHRYMCPEFYRIIKQSHPNWIIIENVVAILRNEINTIIDDLENESYKIQTFNISASSVGAPHKRERIWIVANSDSEPGIKTHKKAESIKSEWHSWMGFARQAWAESRKYWEENKPCLPGMDDGIPSWVDRNKSLGNAIVPQVIFPILKFIFEHECYQEKKQADADRN